MAPLIQTRYPRDAKPPKFLECPFHKYNSIRFFTCGSQPLERMACLWKHFELEHSPRVKPPPWTCPRCREDYNQEQRSWHDQLECDRAGPGESGILLDSELIQYKAATARQGAEISWYKVWELLYPKLERPRTHLVEIAVPYLIAKAETDVLREDYQGLVLRNIYVSYNTPSSGNNRSRNSPPYVSRPARIQPPNTQVGSSQYQGGQRQSPRPPAPKPLSAPSKYQAQLQHVNSQQLPRQGPSLQSLQNETQSQQQHVQPQQALPRAPPSHIAAFGKQHVTQHAPQPQAPHPRLPGDGTLGHPIHRNDPPLPRKTPIESHGTTASSIGRQSLDFSQPQVQEYSPRNEIDIFSDPPWGPDNLDIPGIKKEYVEEEPRLEEVSVEDKMDLFDSSKH